MRSSLLSALAGAASVSAMAIPDSHDYSNEGVCHVETYTVKLTTLDHFVGHSFPLLTPAQALKGVTDKQSGNKSPVYTLATYNPAAAPYTMATSAAASTGSVGGSNYTAAASSVPTNAAGLGPIASSYIPALSTALEYLTKSPSGVAPTQASGSTYQYTLGFSISPTSTPSVPYPISGGNYTGSAASTGFATSTTAPASSVTSSSGASSSASATSSSSSSHSATPSASGCSNPQTRYEWRDMPDADKLAYVTAEKCLFDSPSKGIVGATNRHEDLQALHQQLDTTIHGVGQFLPFHRYFMHAHEVLLRTECGYKGAMPWWDETKDAGNFHKAPMFTSLYFGTAAEKTKDGLGTCVSDGAFANVELHIGPGSSNSAHCLSRAVDDGVSADISNNFLATCNSHTEYSDMLDCVFPGPHAYGHDAMGAVMSDVASSPGDPIFYLHHGMIDRAWAQWQSASPSNKKAIGGYTTQSSPFSPVTLEYVMTTMKVIPDVKVGDVMDIKGGYLCYQYNY